ncbi:MAG: anthranilate synthase component I family protein, partial [Salinarimonas sp.]
MEVAPAFAEVAAAWEAGRPSLVATRLVADLETPVAAFLKLRRAQAGPAFLLESVEGGAQRGRYSMIGVAPDLVWRCRDGACAVDRSALSGERRFEPDPRPPLESLRALIAESRIPGGDDLPPMAAGLFGYLGYDMVREMERLGPPNPDVLDLPDAVLVRPTVMVVFDAVRDEISLVAPVRPRPGTSAKAAFESALARLEAVIDALEAPLPADARAEIADTTTIDVVSNTPPEAYEAMVEQAKEYIRAGDIFQVVLSQRFEAAFPLPAFALYRSLRRTNPSPFLCYLDFEDYQIVVSSPEILVRVRDGEVTIRPIAGTRPRGATPAEDRAHAEDLLADPKERAEHLMLLDLGRNDAGRVSELGSVRVTDSFFLEYYSQVMHIVSNVVGRLDPRRYALDALVAGFPAGTASGAPKVRAM